MLDSLGIYSSSFQNVQNRFCRFQGFNQSALQFRMSGLSLLCKFESENELLQKKSVAWSFHIRPSKRALVLVVRQTLWNEWIAGDWPHSLHHNLKNTNAVFKRDGKLNLGGGFKYFLFSPLLGEMIQFDWYFSNGLKPPPRNSSVFLEVEVPHRAKLKLCYLSSLVPTPLCSNEKDSI